MRHLTRGGTFLRVVDPHWADPLDTSFARARGGRWNPPGSYGCLYLNADLQAARANVALRFHGRPYSVEDAPPERQPQLAEVLLPDERYTDALTPAGLRALALPATYPRDRRGQPIPHQRCQPIGEKLFRLGELGVLARCAAPGGLDGEELAWFAQPRRRAPQLISRHPFDLWYPASRSERPPRDPSVD